MNDLRNFTYKDISDIQKHDYTNLEPDELKNLIGLWNTKLYEGEYFEMFAVTEEDTLVGCVSLYRRSPSIVSCGIKIYPEFQGHGYSAAAYEKLLQAAKERGFGIAVAQVRADNAAGIALHQKMGFEAENYTYINAKGNSVYYFIKKL